MSANLGSKDAGARQAWVLTLASLGSFLVILDMMVVATALTTIRRDLHASLGELEWTVNAYTLSFAVLLMTAAALGDRFGRRRLYAAGLGLFAASSAACALAPNVGALIAARTVQGVGAAMVIPVALALLNAAVPPQRRGWAIGIYGSVTTIAVVLGPILGGAVTQGLGWQWIFWFNVPIALGAIPFLFAYVEESFGPAARLDVPGLALVTLAALGLVWGLVRANSIGWSAAETLAALVVGALAAIAFVVWERRAPAPMLPPHLFRSRAFSAGNAAIFLLNAGMTGAVFLMPQFQQVALGQGPLDAGLRMLPWGIAPFLIARRAGVLADQIGERVLAVTGLALVTIGMAWFALIAAPGLSYLDQIAPLAVSGIGFGVGIPALTRAATSRVAPADIGKASGAFSTMRQLGGAFGVAIVAVTFSATGGYTSPRAFSDGFAAAYGVVAGLAFAALIAGAVLPGRKPPAAAAPEPARAPVSERA